MKGLTERDRALIDAAIAAGKLQVIAQGVSGLPLPVWDGKQLVNPDPVEAKRVMRNRLFSHHRREPGGEVRARREAVAQLHAEGLWCAAIANRLELAEYMVRSDLAVLGLAAHPVPAEARAPVVPSKAVLERREIIRSMAEAGATLDLVAARLGFSEDAVRKMAARIGVTVAPKPRRSGAAAVANRRREDIRACLDEGMTRLAICERLSIARGTLEGHLRHMGIRPAEVPTGLVRAPAGAMQARRARVAELRRGGASLAQIVAEIGVKKALINADLRALGLSFPRLSGTNVAAPGVHLPSKPERDALAARREQVRAMISAGQTRRQIREQLRIGRHALDRDITALGLDSVVRKGVPGPVVESDPAAREARLAEVARLLGAGTNHRAILCAVGGTIGRLRSDLKALALAGVIALKPRDPDRKAKIAARRAEVARLLAAGVRPAEIQRRVGGSNGRIDRDIDVARRMLEAAKSEMQVAA